MLRLVTAPLASPELRDQIEARWQQLYEEERDTLSPLRGALVDSPWDRDPNFRPAPGWHLDPACSRFWLSLEVDWKGDEEVQWQVQAIARILDIPGTFGCDTPGPWARTQEALEEAADWMRERGHELVFLTTGGDHHMALPIAAAQVGELQAELERMGIGSHLM